MENETLFKEFYSYVRENIVPFFSKEMCRKFEIYFHEINKWSDTLNLISIKNEKDIIYRHFCDSLYSTKVINSINNNKFSYLNVADIGTGSGMPGVPVKISLPNIKLTLIESITKKCKFLENINNKLEFNIKILNKRAEEVGRDSTYRQKYDFVLSRAVSKFSPNLEISIPLLKVGGYFIVYKTKRSIESLKEGTSSIKNSLKCLGAKIEQTIFYNLPEQKLNYCILVFRKYKNTPSSFPRKSEIYKKNPL
ncbi:MAG: 16S rRNA (guanine(527)-N(7))-methyltransferase RsmG [Endomicrobium sp.]|jgi:16S rRNA (guanine527-N7)-methyltransferase|nr:16S rRNA (guanine(527)-N(7))-methyltransferase RsmG [Endomicrobium sp.]